MPEPSVTKITVDHVTIPSARPFHEVRERLERSLPRMNPDIVVLLRCGDADRASAQLRKRTLL